MDIGAALFAVTLAFTLALGYGIGSEAWKAWRGTKRIFRLTISKPDDDRVLASAELDGWDERNIDRLIPMIVDQGFKIAVRELEKEYAKQD